MVWQILHGVHLDVQESLLTRSPFLEMDSLQGSQKTTKANARKNLEAAANMKGPRVIKTHLPIDMLPKDVITKAKVVFVARNPMDCCVSFFHHERLVPKKGFLGTFEQYAKLFRNGRNPMGDYWYHLKVGKLVLYEKATTSVTRLGDLLHFGQLFKACCNHYFAKIAPISSRFCQVVEIFHFASEIIFG